VSSLSIHQEVIYIEAGHT